MFAGIRKRLTRKQLEKDCDDDDKEDMQDLVPPPNFIQISQGKIQLVHQSRSLENESLIAQDKKDKELLAKRLNELEAALRRLQEQFHKNQSKSQCGSPTFEKELREQLENMNRLMKSKERKQLQTCRDHKALQTRFARQESLLHAMQQENRALLHRIRQYEHCLDDVMRKVVDAIVAEDNLREEVVMLKTRVRDLEAQNAALSASPVKGRDEGYCTMSSGQPQPSNGQLEDLPEEPEQWLLPAEPCSTEMEDWSMSQEELAVINFDEERQQQQQQQMQYKTKRNQPKMAVGTMAVNQCDHDWLWSSNDFINSTTIETDSVADSIAQLLQQKIIYSEDEEVTCTDFTNDFYKLVNIRSNSARSLYSYLGGATDDEDDDEENDEGDEDDDSSLSMSQKHQKNPLTSPTPSEAGRLQLTSCSSSSDADEHSSSLTTAAVQAASKNAENDYEVIDDCRLNGQENSDTEIENVEQIITNGALNEQECITEIIKTGLRTPPHILVKSKSVLEEDEPSCILRQNQRREMISRVVRSGSINCALAAKISNEGNGLNKPQELLSQRSINSWRRSNGWKRVASPVQKHQDQPQVNALDSPKKETKKAPPTRIPTSKPVQAQQHNNQIARALQQQHSTSPTIAQQQQQRKSKIPPPVPVRRSYAS